MNSELRDSVDKVESFVFAHMTKEAMERYGRVKAIHTDASLIALHTLAQQLKKGQVRTISDDYMKSTLRTAQRR